MRKAKGFDALAQQVCAKVPEYNRGPFKTTPEGYAMEKILAHMNSDSFLGTIGDALKTQERARENLTSLQT